MINTIIFISVGLSVGVSSFGIIKRELIKEKIRKIKEYRKTKNQKYQENKRLLENIKEYQNKKLYKYVNKTKGSIRCVKKKSESSIETCVICLDDYQENNIIIKLLCGHKYHVLCLGEWVDEKKTCPLCNLPLKKRKKDKKRNIIKVNFDQQVELSNQLHPNIEDNILQHS